jgi:ABC-type dipeptide/oligopeptide/nickel transport system permease component
MKKTIITYGLISGAIVGAMLFGTMSLYESEKLKLDNGELIGYTTMVIALSLIFFGIKSLRDNQFGGNISFWKGCQVGLLITLIASVIYALSWEISYQNIGDSFIEKMNQHYMSEMKADGLSDQEIQTKKAEMDVMWEYYRNPIIRFGITLAEIFPVGIILTLISAGLLRKKEILPAAASSQSATTN